MDILLVAGCGPSNQNKTVFPQFDALDIEHGAFKKRTAKAIAQSLKRSADRSKRRKAGPFQSAMSMLNFYINRAGKNLTAAELSRLEHAKDELRKLYGRDAPKREAKKAKVSRPKKSRR